MDPHCPNNDSSILELLIMNQTRDKRVLLTYIAVTG